jgi:hypothetical protein
MAGSLIKVDEFTISSPVSSIILGGGSSGSSGLNASIDSTYDVYMVQYLNVFMSSNARNRIRFTVSGSADTSANYDGAMKQMYANQAYYNSSPTNATYINSLSLGTTQDKSDNGTLYLFNFNNASEYSFITQEQIQTNDAGEIAGIMGGSVLTVAQATDGIQFFASTGNIASGQFVLYGLAK